MKNPPTAEELLRLAEEKMGSPIPDYAKELFKTRHDEFWRSWNEKRKRDWESQFPDIPYENQ
jgi:hypothetical protein